MNEIRLWWLRNFAKIDYSQAKKMELYYLGAPEYGRSRKQRFNIWIDNRGRKYKVKTPRSYQV